MKRQEGFAPLILVTAGLLMACDGDDGVTAPENVPDVSGLWSGQYEVTGCTLTDAADDFFCSFLFEVGASLILEVDLLQDGSALSGELAQGGLLGDVDGSVDEEGVVRLSGVISPEDTLLTTTILAWQTSLVGDSLKGSWRFRAEDRAGAGFGTATVDANIRLLAPEVPRFFGCPLDGALSIDGQVSGALNEGDCELADRSFFDLYALTGTAGDSLEITLRSTEIDAFLLIADLEETILAANDDISENDTDALITPLVFETSGSVFVVANSFSGGETGSYTLSATRLGPAPVAGDQVTLFADRVGRVGLDLRRLKRFDEVDGVDAAKTARVRLLRDREERPER